MDSKHIVVVLEGQCHLAILVAKTCCQCGPNGDCCGRCLDALSGVP